MLYVSLCWIRSHRSNITGKCVPFNDFLTDASLFFLSLAVTRLFVNSYSTITCYLYSEPMKHRMQGEQSCGVMESMHSLSPCHDSAQAVVVPLAKLCP